MNHSPCGLPDSRPLPQVPSRNVHTLIKSFTYQNVHLSQRTTSIKTRIGTRPKKLKEEKNPDPEQSGRESGSDESLDWSRLV